MKTKEIKKLTQDQLYSELEKLKKEQFNIRFKKKIEDAETKNIKEKENVTAS